tara:strand:- start:259458 stop:259637 length:180 start_codon:yes stop_codon:yes gene_type:complete
MTTIHEIAKSALLTLAMALGFLIAGCDNDETLLDVDTPDASVEVQRDRDSGDITVKVDD